MPLVPLIEAPDPSQLERALAGATAAVIGRDDGRRLRVMGADLDGLRAVLRVRAGALPVAWAPLAKVSIALTRHRQPVARVEAYGDLSVRLLSWGMAAAAAEPAALAKWLADHGVDTLARALDRGARIDAALAAWRAAAPAEIRRQVDALAAEPRLAADAAWSEAAVRALQAARGGLAGAAWALAAWYGARAGAWRDAYAFEAVIEGALRRLGVHEVIDAAAGGVPQEARAGVARFLVENVTSRGWNLQQRLPEDVRRGLVEAARATGDADDAARAARLLLGEGALAPSGSTLVAAAASGSFRRLTAGGADAFAADGHDLVRLQKGRGATMLTKLFKPDTPLAVRGNEVLVLQPGGVERVRADGEGVRAGRGPLFDLPARRLPRLIERYVAARDEALARAVPAGAEVLPLDADADACAAYEAFGGDLPAALRLRSFWGGDAGRGVMIEVPRRGEPREIALDGRPVWLGATERGVLVVVDRGGATAILAIDEGGPARALGVVGGDADDVLGAIPVSGGVWLRLAAPLGDVLVAVDPGG
ncbi:MAG: hypothetical protein QM820_33285 [Minicystis sp.]